MPNTRSESLVIDEVRTDQLTETIALQSDRVGGWYQHCSLPSRLPSHRSPLPYLAPRRIADASPHLQAET